MYGGLIMLTCDGLGGDCRLQHVVLVLKLFFFFSFFKVRPPGLIENKSCQGFTTSAHQKYAVTICSSHPNQNHLK